MKRVLRPGVVAALSYFALSFVLLAPSLRPGHTVVPTDILTVIPPYQQAQPGTVVHNPLPSDSPFQFYPWLQNMSDSLRDGHIPQWNPEVLAGIPETPNGFVSPYYPPFWLAAIVSPLTAYGLFIALHLALGALGAYALARTLDVDAVPSWIAGLCMFAAEFWVHWSLHLVHLVGMALVPWVLAATVRAVRRPTPGSAALLALAFGLWWLGANPQYAYYGTLAMAVVAVVMLGARVASSRREGAVDETQDDELVTLRGPIARKVSPVGWRRALADLWRPVATLAGGLLVGTMLAAPVLLPSAGTSGDILRQSEPVGAIADSHFPAYDLLGLAIPDIRGSGPAHVLYRPHPYGLALDTPFVGVTTLLLAAAAMGAARQRRRVWLAWVIASGAVLVLAFTALPHHLLYPLIPGYDRFRSVTRWLSLLPAVLAPAAAGGMAAILAGGSTARRWTLGAAAAGGALIAVIAVVVLTSDGAPVGYLSPRLAAAAAPLALVAIAVLLVRRRPQMAVAVVALAIVGEAVVHTAPWYSSVPQSKAYPALAMTKALSDRGGRLIRVNPERTTIPGFAPDIPMAYGLADAQGLAVLFPKDYDRYRRLIDNYGTYAEAFNGDPPLADPKMLSSPLLDVLDVRSVLASSAVPMPAQYPLVTDGEPRVYARTSLGPAHLVPVAEPARTTNQLWAAVGKPGWDPASTASVLDLTAPVHGGLGTVTAGADKGPDGDAWHVNAPAGGLLRVSGRYADGWTAAVDGAPARVYRTDGIFRGIVIPAGSHEVTEHYRNPQEETGRKVALAGLVALLGLAAPASLAALTLRNPSISPPWRRMTRHRRGATSDDRGATGDD